MSHLDPFIDADGLIVMTYINCGYFDYLHNFITNMRMLNIPWKLCVVCIDAESVQLCKNHTIDCVHLQLNKSLEFAKWNTANFLDITYAKLDVITHVLQFKNVKKIIYVDTDIWIYKDFVPYLKPLPYMLYMQSDCHKVNEYDSNACTGFMYISNNVHTRTLFHYHNEPKHSSDQHYVNQKMKQLKIPCIQLDRSLFPNGIYINHVPPNALLLHYNYIVGDEKRNCMKANKHWLLNV